MKINSVYAYFLVNFFVVRKMTPVCLLEWLSAALLFFPKPSTFLKKKKRAHKEVWKTTSPENKNFSGKEK